MLLAVPNPDGSRERRRRGSGISPLMAERAREGCDRGRGSLPPTSVPQVTFRGHDGYSVRTPGQFLAAKMMLWGIAASFLTARNKRGLRILWYRSFTKGEDNDKIRLLLVETATLDTAAERIEGLFFNVFIVC